MVGFCKVWMDQCEAARGIRERFGLDTALGYLIGEKSLNFLEASDQDAEFVAEVPRFVNEIREIFEPAEILTYLDEVRRVGALGHIANDEAYEEMRAAGAIPDGPVEWAEQILLIQRAKELLLS